MYRNRFSLFLSILVFASLLLGPSQGKQLEEAQGWLGETLGARSGCHCQPKKRPGRRLWEVRPGYWASRTNTFALPVLRSLCLWGLWQLSGQMGPDWLPFLPWLIWLLPTAPKPWGRIQQYLWQVQRIFLVGYLGLSATHLLAWLLNQGSWTIGWLGCVVCGTEPQVEIQHLEDGTWQADLNGHFTLKVGAEHPFRLRLLLIFLGLLQSENDTRHSRRTRDGRTPFVRQEQLARWTQIKQEQISLWMQSWLAGDWAKLLGLKTAEVLTPELVERIVTVLATFPDWTDAQAYVYLQKQGCPVSYSQIEQASQTSGWKMLRANLNARFDLKAGLHLRDEWLVSQLLGQIQALLTRVEALGGLTPEVRHSVEDLQTLAAQAGGVTQTPFPAKPWLLAFERTLLGSDVPVVEGQLQCTYCGSTAVACKSKRPRLKKFSAADGLVQEIEVYRYYCHNPDCSKKTFTHFPIGLVPYSPYRAQVHLLSLQMYAWGYSTYRRSSTALGISSMTAWRWVSAWGHALLPIAALFGVVKSSGVVGVDEKYVLVPKNDKPAGKMRRWMYVYLAVDAWTYDLLHIEIYPYNTEASATAFLLALRAKGYYPQVIVTDLRQDYGPVITQVFPAAQHHECIFHALQNVQKHIKEVYGPRYASEHPEAALLKQQIYQIFDTQTFAEAQARYQEVLQQKNTCARTTPEATRIFDFLEHHWPKLSNAIGSTTIPTTNNITELVIRRFDQHYQNFCGFQSIESAQAYLAVFEKLYRFTPFTQDAQPRIRGRSPLQLAGYDLSQVPMAAICSGLSIDWPTQTKLVPS